MVAACDAKAELSGAFGRHAPHHSHSLGLIQLFLQLVLGAGLGFRGSSAALKTVSLLFPTEEPSPSPNGGQMWLLRIGLYELSRPKEVADDWAWLIDHTIQTGHGKCFVVVGIRLSAWEAKRAAPNRPAALEHQDLSAWMVEPVERSDGATVCRQLLELSQKTGVVPREVLSDCGGDVQNGIGRFREAYPQTAAKKDIAHTAANAVKRELNHDATWQGFLREANQAKTEMRQTKWAFLLPPDLKAKARWMNLDSLVKWSRKAMGFVASPRPVPGVFWEQDELEEQMGWIRAYQRPLAAWSGMLEVTGTSLEYVRQHGYHQDARRELEDVLMPFTSGNEETPGSRVARHLLDFVGQQSSDIPPGQRLLGSTEVLESLIGKAKQLEGQQSRSGFTKMILGAAASVVRITEATLQTALAMVKVHDVARWIREHLGTSVQGQRMHAFPAESRGTELA